VQLRFLGIQSYSLLSRIAKRQIFYLKKAGAFFLNETLEEPRMIETKIKCLKFWKIPGDMKKLISLEPISQKLKELCGAYGQGIQKLHLLIIIIQI